MKVILTGSSGMVGTAVSQYLGERGVAVLAAGRNASSDLFFDPLATGRRELSWPPCDAVIHVAAANEIDCRENPADALLINVLGTQIALEECVRKGISKFIYVSTFHVYGAATGLVDENTPPRPIDNYGLTHLFAEQCVELYARKHGLSTTVLRPSNLFGLPRKIDQFNRWTLIPYAFCKEAVATGKVVLKTPGTQLRNFVHLDHLCNAIFNAAGSKLPSQLLNIAGQDTPSVRQFADLVAQRALVILGRTIEVLAPVDTAESQVDPLLFRSAKIPLGGNEATSLVRFIDELLVLCNQR